MVFSDFSRARDDTHVSAVLSARLETPPSVTHYSLGSHAVNISADKAAVSADGIATLAIRDVSVAKPSSTALPPCVVRRCDELIFAERPACATFVRVQSWRVGSYGIFGQLCGPYAC